MADAKETTGALGEQRREPAMERMLGKYSFKVCERAEKAGLQSHTGLCVCVCGVVCDVCAVCVCASSQMTQC